VWIRLASARCCAGTASSVPEIAHYTAAARGSATDRCMPSARARNSSSYPAANSQARSSRPDVLVTATAHSGAEEGFRNLLELLDPACARSTSTPRLAAKLLARHLVQRRRGDIRRYLDQDTPFPSDRQTQERPYPLTPDYRAPLRPGPGLRPRVGARQGGRPAATAGAMVLALLRALASSPRGDPAHPCCRVTAATPEEADALGRAAVLDLADDEALETADATTDADPEAEADAETSEHRRLLGFAREADKLEGPAHNAKLAEVTKVVTGRLADGYDPIVFCRFIDTAEYVATHLSAARKKTATVAAVTGQLPPFERVARIAELGATGDRTVLVATDCGVNLQKDFQTVGGAGGRPGRGVARPQRRDADHPAVCRDGVQAGRGYPEDPGGTQTRDHRPGAGQSDHAGGEGTVLPDRAALCRGPQQVRTDLRGHTHAPSGRHPADARLVSFLAALTVRANRAATRPQAVATTNHEVTGCGRRGTNLIFLVAYPGPCLVVLLAEIIYDLPVGEGLRSP